MVAASHKTVLIIEDEKDVIDLLAPSWRAMTHWTG